MFDIYWDVAVRQLEDLEDSNKIVVIHPDFVKQHVLLDYFLATYPTVYVRVTTDNDDLTGLQKNVDDAVKTQIQLDGSIDALHIVLDEYDRVDQVQSDEFLQWLLNKPYVKRVILVGRSLPPCILPENDLHVHTRIIPNMDVLMLFDYANRKSKLDLLEVRAFGKGSIILNGKIIDNWDGTLARLLFFFLIDKGMVRRDLIFETFWPDLTKQEATNVFHVTKRKISEILGVNLTQYSSGYYHINPEIEVSYDVMKFTELAQNSDYDHLTNEVSFRHALALYRNMFLHPVHMEWAETRRRELNQLYSSLLLQIGTLWEQKDNLEKALGYYARSLSADFQSTDTMLKILEVYVSQQKTSEAKNIYEQYIKSAKEYRLDTSGISAKFDFLLDGSNN